MVRRERGAGALDLEGIGQQFRWVVGYRWAASRGISKGNHPHAVEGKKANKLRTQVAGTVVGPSALETTVAVARPSD